jgi:septum site-determining protein MinD
MKSITIAVSKGGVGKSLLTANVGAALADKGKKVVLIEGDPNRPLQTILGIDTSSGFKLDEVVKKDLEIDKAVRPTKVDNLFLVPSGVSLQDYFDIDPVSFAKKLMSLKADFMLVDVPFPMGRAAFLSLGICEYFVIILTEDEFVLCVESAIDTIRLGRYFLKCVPVGFILNRVKTPEKFTADFVKDIEHLLEIPCIGRLEEDPRISKSYGEVRSKKSFLAYKTLPASQFVEGLNETADLLLGELPKPEKADPVKFIQDLIKPLKMEPIR